MDERISWVQSLALCLVPSTGRPNPVPRPKSPGGHMSRKAGFPGLTIRGRMTRDGRFTVTLTEVRRDCYELEYEAVTGSSLLSTESSSSQLRPSPGSTDPQV